MSRVFWMAVGAVGGVVAYRKGTQAMEQARELGPLGSARATAAATSRLAGRTAHGLSRLENIRDRRAGRLIVGSVEQDDASAPQAAASAPAVASVPAGWVPAERATQAPTGGTSSEPEARPSAAPSVVVFADGDTGESSEPAQGRSQGPWTPGSAGSATSRTTRPRRG